MATHRVILYACTTTAGNVTGILAELQRHAVENGWHIVGSYADRTGAAAEAARPDFLDAKAAIARGEADAILTRYPAMAAYLPNERAALGRWLEQQGATIHYTRTPGQVT